MDDLAIAPIGVEGDISLEQSGYEAWSHCVRRLLGWSSGEMADWPALFASGHTPRDVARAVVYGESTGD
jgi:hypothetical protein